MRSTLACAVLFAGLAGAAAPIPKADPVPAVTKEHLTASKNNLKQMGLAVNDFASANRDLLPSDIPSKDGKPLLSWRVAILPFVEETALHKEFKLDEPWDSDTNKKLIEKMPKLYAPVRVKAKAGETFYQMFSAIFSEKNGLARYTIANIPDGNSNTACVVEAGEPVVWSKPGHLPADGKKLPKLGGLFDGEFHVLLYDGSVALVKKDFDENEMWKLITPDDGNLIDFKKLQK